MAMTHPGAGVWVIQESHSVQEVRDKAANVRLGLETPGIVGYGARIPANAIMTAPGVFDDRVLDAAYALTDPAEHLFAPRIIWGQFTPDWIKAAGGTVTWQGLTAPRPFTSATGAANVPFEDAQEDMNGHLIAWSSGRRVPGIHGGWHSFRYSELFLGGTQGTTKLAVQALFGLPLATVKQHCADAWKRLMQKQYALCRPAGLFSAFGFSGHGPIDGVTDQLAAYIITLTGTDFSPWLLCNANGWNPNGEWGGALEPAHDAAVYPRPLQFGLQDIHPAQGGPRTAANYQRMFTTARQIDQDRPVVVTWAELYADQWTSRWLVDGAALTAMKAEILAFTAARTVDDPPDPDDCDEVRAQLVAAQNDLQALEASLAASQAVVADQRAKLVQVGVLGVQIEADGQAVQALAVPS